MTEAQERQAMVAYFVDELGGVMAGAHPAEKRPRTTRPDELGTAPWDVHQREGHLDRGIADYIAGKLPDAYLVPGSIRTRGAWLRSARPSARMASRSVRASARMASRSRASMRPCTSRPASARPTVTMAMVSWLSLNMVRSIPARAGNGPSFGGPGIVRWRFNEAGPEAGCECARTGRLFQSMLDCSGAIRARMGSIVGAIRI